MKWTRQRCQAAPMKTFPIASFSPRCWSETTSRTPESPRSAKPAEELRPKGPVLGVADVAAEHLAVAARRSPR